MTNTSLPVTLALCLLAPCSMLPQAGLEVTNVAVGSNLQAEATIKLSQPAPEGGVDITITSDDANRLLLSKRPDAAGSGTISLSLRSGFIESPPFWLQALANSGEATYTVKASGFSSRKGTVTLTPSAVMIVGPFEAPSFRTTSGAEPSKIALYSARLDSSLNYVERQTLAGGRSVKVEINSSDIRVGKLMPLPVEIGGGLPAAVADFTPVAPGTTTLSVSEPPGFSTPAQSATLVAQVSAPGIALTDQVTIGENLQVGGVVGLGEMANTDVKVTLTSENPSKLLLSPAATQIGSGSITITIPRGGVNARFYLQALGKSGAITYNAAAPGYVSRVANVALAPSGVTLRPRPYGPPDEAELFKDPSQGSPGFIAHLSRPLEMPLVVWTAQLDPVTLRSADVTVQPLRPGMSLKVSITSSNPTVGRVLSPVVIGGGSESGGTQFTPLSAGSTVISAITPEGFTRSSNSTSVIAIVRQ